MIPRRCLLLSFLLLFPAAPRAQEAGRRGTPLTLDLSSLVRNGGEEVQALFGPPLGTLGEDEELLPSDPGAVPPVPPGTLADLLGQALGGGGDLVRRGGGRFFLSGSPQALERASSLGKALLGALGRPLRVEGVWFDPPEGGLSLGSVLGPGEAARLWKGLEEGSMGRASAWFSLQVLPGGSVLWTRSVSQSRVGRFDAEVAAKSKITYPVFVYPKTGFQARVRASLLQGGRAALFLDVWRSGGMSFRKVEIGLPRTPWIEAGRGDFFLQAASGAVSRGGGLLLRVSPGEGGACLAVRVTDLPVPQDRVVYLGPVFLPWHRDLGLPLPPSPGSEEVWISSGKEGEEAPLDPDKFKNLLAAAGLVPGAVFPSGAMLPGSTWVRPAWTRTASSLHLLSPGTCRVRILFKGMALSSSRGRTPAEIFQGGKVLREISFPVLEDRTGIFAAGKEIQYLEGYLSNVAQKSAVLVPDLGTLFSGITGKITVKGNTASVRILHRWCSEPVRVDPGAKESGPLERITQRACLFSGEIPVDGRFRILGEGVMEEEGGEPVRVAAGILLERG